MNWIVLATGVVGVVVSFVEHRRGSTLAWPAFVISFVAGGVLISSYVSWVNMRSEKESVENQHPRILFSEPTVERASSSYYNIEFPVETTAVHGALAYIVSMCLWEKDKCDDKLNFKHKLPIGWHAGPDSFAARTIDKDNFVAFFISDDNDHKLSTFGKYADGTFQWGSDVKQGKYKLVVEVEGTESSATATYMMDWYGDPNTVQFTRLDQ